MRKSLIFIALTLVLALAAGAQAFPTYPGQASLESGITAGLFTNNIDSSFNPSSAFGAADAPFIFAGLSGNPLILSNSGTSGTFAGGYYQDGELPFSAYGSFSATTLATALANDSTANSYSANVPVTTGTPPVTTNYKWVTDKTTMTYSQPSALATLNLTLQGLLKIAGITTGLYFNQTGNWSATNGDSAFYANAVTETYYNSATAGVAPVATLDYTTTTVTSNIDATALPALWGNGANTISTQSTAFVPFALATGKIKHFGYANLVLAKNDSSGSYSVTETAHFNTAPNINDEILTVNYATSMTTLGALYGATLPGFFLKDKGAEFSAGLALSDRITAQNYSYSDKVMPYSINTTKVAQAGGTLTSGSTTIKNANYLDLSAFAAHSIPLVSNEAVKFILKPTAVIQYTSDNNTAGGGILESSESYTQNLNASFEYDSSAYTKTKVAQTGAPASQSKLGLGATLPMAFEIKPTGWPFGFFMGTTPTLTLLWTKTTSSGATTTTTTENWNSGAIVSSTVTATYSSATSSTKLSPSLGETHSLGIFVPLGNDLRLDVDLNGSNLLVFDNLTFQVYVPLK